MRSPASGARPLLGLVALTLAACSEARPARAPNVLLVCLDTVRADHLGTYGYGRPTTPTLDALAARALVFEDASAVAGWTKPSVPSFLTGTYPCQHGVYEGSASVGVEARTDLLPAAALTLAEVFQAHGYRTGAVVNNAHLRTGNGFEQGFEHYDQSDHDARTIRWRALDWVDQARAGAEPGPFFLYLHFLDAHWPYSVPEEWLTRFADAAAVAPFRGRDSRALYEAVNAGERTLEPAEREALVALYDGALAYLDAELGRLLAGLALRGLEQDTIVCVIADHGEEFGEHGRLGHGHGLWENLLRVPWILRVPGRAPARHAAPVSLVDLFPTLLAAAGIPAPEGHEGVERLAHPDATRPLLAEHKAPDRYLQSLRAGPTKLLRELVPPPGTAVTELLLPIRPGTRWEAELEVEDGELVATQLKPRDEPVDDPPELKGVVLEPGATGFRLGNVLVRLDEETERQFDAGTAGPELAQGQVVKVRGRPGADGFAAERVKFYAPGESEQLEIRATVEDLALAGESATLTMAGLRVRITRATELKDVGPAAAPASLPRAELAELLASGAGAQAAARGYERVRSLFDLARDPGELEPRPVEDGTELERALEELGRALAARRRFAASDQKALDAAALRELEAIGY
ncbi:MAG TPA: sulfatase-like hydrolase/transferase [Planctomycetota bacterium]